MKSIYKIGLLFLCYSQHGVFAQQKGVAVFSSGTEGYKSFRIPAMVKLASGKLLAFCEGRVNGAGDFGNVDIVLKTSSDNGKSWSALQKVVDADSLQAGNAAPVMDITDPRYPKGRLFLFYNTGNNHEGEIRKGRGVREVWYITSTDEGSSWSAPINITLQVHRPNQPAFNPAYHFTEDWRSYANTPGHAIQLSEGKYKGRIYIAANHSTGAPQPHFTDYTAHGYYSDDHGKTFSLSENVPVPGSNENMAVELSGDKLMLNMRNQQGNIKTRIIAISRNGGQNWDSTCYDKNLPDPVCQGSIIIVGKREGKPVIAFCNAADTLHRNHLTLRISYDEGKSWPISKLVDEATASDGKDFTAYSDIVLLFKQRIGILYERDNYKEIRFVAMKY